MSWRSAAMAGVMAMGLAAASAPAEATVVYDNMAQQSNPALSAVSVNTSGPLGAQFVSNALSAGVVNVQLLLTGSTESTGSFIVTIVGDTSNAPNFSNVIYNSGVVADSSLTDIGDYLVWNSGTIFAPVSASTAYWVMVTENVNTSVQWTYADNDPSGIPANLASLYNYYDATSWVNDNYPFVMRVECMGISEGPCNSNIVDAPEPATIGVLGAGLVALGVAIRRRRNMAA